MGCERQESLFFGDNGGRMSALGLPHLLHEAASKGYRLLPGSDPFPFGRDYTRVGAFGFLAGLELDTCAPWTSLQDWLQKQANQPSGYGHGLGPLKFAFNQAWIQVHNRIPARSRA